MLEWLFPRKYSTNDELQLLRHYSGCYHEPIVSRTTIDSFIEKYWEQDLVASCSLNRLFFPVADCDSETMLEAARTWLVENDKSHIVIRSSPGHYWVILDGLKKSSAAVSLMARVPGNHNKYVNMSSRIGQAVLRCIPKGNFLPSVTHTHNVGSFPPCAQFAARLVEVHSDRRILSMARARALDDWARMPSGRVERPLGEPSDLSNNPGDVFEVERDSVQESIANASVSTDYVKAHGKSMDQEPTMEDDRWQSL